MVRRWDCIFVDRIESGRIYLTKPQVYGLMYVSADGKPSEETKVRKTIPRECGPIKGSSNEHQILVATAIAIALNHDKLESSGGLVLRGFDGRTPIPGLQTAEIETRGQNLRIKGSTGWLVYISPELRVHSIDGNHLEEEVSSQQRELISKCTDAIRIEWRLKPN